MRIGWMDVALVGVLLAVVGVGQDARPDTKAAATPEAIMLLKGQCHCGQVTYEAQGPIVKCSYCDCRGCQKATGTLKAPYVTVNRAGFRITAGEPAEFRAATGEKCDAHGVWVFCAKCGAPLFWKGHKGTELDILAGTLEDRTVFKPKE